MLFPIRTWKLIPFSCIWIATVTLHLRECSRNGTISMGWGNQNFDNLLILLWGSYIQRSHIHLRGFDFPDVPNLWGSLFEPCEMAAENCLLQVPHKSQEKFRREADIWVTRESADTRQLWSETEHITHFCVSSYYSYPSHLLRPANAKKRWAVPSVPCWNCWLIK